jgi:hypothetical protein
MVSDKALFSVFNDFAKVQVNNFETAADKQKQQPQTRTTKPCKRYYVGDDIVRESRELENFTRRSNQTAFFRNAFDDLFIRQTMLRLFCEDRINDNKPVSKNMFGLMPLSRLLCSFYRSPATLINCF